MSKPNNLIGRRFGKLVVIGRAENDRFGKTRWLCQCDCGNQKVINGSSLLRGLTTSCGCKHKMNPYNTSRIVDETGHRYGKLVVLSLNTDPEYQTDGRAMWNCKCDCGNTCVVSGKLLRSGHVRSCGCQIKSVGENTIEQILTENNYEFSPQYRVYIKQQEYKVAQTHPYYFDFAILTDNRVSYFIEYDGVQHFKYKENADFWNNKEAFEKTQVRDRLKNQWCKDNNIPLIRIPYTHLKDLCIDDLKLDTTKFRVY